MRWIVVAIVAGGCWHSVPARRAIEPRDAFGCFTWRGVGRGGTVCTTRVDCDALRDDKLLRDDSWSYGRCSGAAAIACFVEEPDFVGKRRPPDIEHCFADTDECERYRAHARSPDRACRVLQSPKTSSLIAP